MVLPSHAGRRPHGGALRHPARLVTLAFVAGVLAGTALLALPIASEGPRGAGIGTAAFTATSALTVTGLIVVDTPSQWSAFGEVVLLGLIQLGGLGIMTLASLVLIGLFRKIGLRRRLLAQAETGVLTLGEVRKVLRTVVVLSFAVEVFTAVALFARFVASYDESVGRAGWLALFHAVSAFNNAGFALFRNSLTPYATDPVVNVVVAGAIVVGGLGVPVLRELWDDKLSWRRWSLHTKLTLTASAVLLLAGWALMCAFEWTNPSTLGALETEDKVLAGMFHSVSARTAGFNTVPVGGMRETTWLVTSVLMFIGAAPASTGGGIKVTTFALLGFVILSEARGDRDVSLFGRRSPPAAERQALSIALLSIGAVAAATLGLLTIENLGLSRVLFETTSAFGTVGLSTGITEGLSGAGQLVLGLLMFAGRVGPLTVAAALAVRSRDNRFRLPEERPLIG